MSLKSSGCIRFSIGSGRVVSALPSSHAHVTFRTKAAVGSIDGRRLPIDTQLGLLFAGHTSLNDRDQRLLNRPTGFIGSFTAVPGAMLSVKKDPIQDKQS